MPLLWHSVQVSAQPRSGTMFAARLQALYAALDLYVRLDVYGFKASPDGRKIALVVGTCALGQRTTTAMAIA